MSGELLRYRAVIFDLFGTLLEVWSWAEFHEMMADMAATLGAPVDEFSKLWLSTNSLRMTGHFASTEANIEHVCRELSVEPASTQIDTAARIRLDFAWRTFVPRPDAIATLTQLKNDGYRTGLISDCSHEVPVLWNDTPFAPLIDAAVHSCTVGFKKPGPRIYALACERLAVSPRECLYVGDGGSHELTGASNAGMTAVLIRVPHEDGIDAHRIDVQEWHGPVVSSLREIMNLLQ